VGCRSARERLTKKGERPQQDFLLTNYSVFFGRNASDYVLDVLENKPISAVSGMH